MSDRYKNYVKKSKADGMKRVSFFVDETLWELFQETRGSIEINDFLFSVLNGLSVNHLEIKKYDKKIHLKQFKRKHINAKKRKLEK